ncbi:MAG: hypothetical protein HZB76_05230 [Chlamydiae bacterium]|nr:hypothetical protein [Chlamydiota bacterium]
MGKGAVTAAWSYGIHLNWAKLVSMSENRFVKIASSSKLGLGLINTLDAIVEVAKLPVKAVGNVFCYRSDKVHVNWRRVGMFAGVTVISYIALSTLGKNGAYASCEADKNQPSMTTLGAAVHQEVCANSGSFSVDHLKDCFGKARDLTLKGTSDLYKNLVGRIPSILERLGYTASNATKEVAFQACEYRNRVRDYAQTRSYQVAQDWLAINEPRDFNCSYYYYNHSQSAEALIKGTQKINPIYHNDTILKIADTLLEKTDSSYHSCLLDVFHCMKDCFKNGKSTVTFPVNSLPSLSDRASQVLTAIGDNTVEKAWGCAKNILQKCSPLH